MRFASIACVLLFVPLSLSHASESPSDKDVKDAMRRWDDWLKMNVKCGADEQLIERLMKGKYRDRASISLGGNGDRIVCYLIDDFLQIAFPMNARRQLSLAPVVQRKGPWLKDPYGDLLYVPRNK